MNFNDYRTELENRVPKIDVGLAISLLGDIYGFNSPVYFPYGDFLDRGYELGSYQLNVVPDEEADRLSQFGTPVLGSFAVRGGTYKCYNKSTGMLEDREYPDFEFPLATIVDFEHPKNIVKTPTIGSNGTVKEIFGFDDWRINIRGICLDDGSRLAQKTAKEQQLAMTQLNEIAGSLDIDRGRLFLEKDITRFVIERLSFSAVQGKPNVIQYEIEASSDEDFLITGI